MRVQHPNQLAAGQLKIAIQRLAGSHPFHARTLERFVPICRPDIATMGVTVAGDDVLLLYNPRFVTEITLDELGGVLLHEVHHVVFRHVVADLAKYTDEWAWTVATEVTVNEHIRLPLPGDPVLLEQFPDLPPMESTEQRYQRLKRKSDRQPIGLAAGLVVAEGADDDQGGPNDLAGLVDDHAIWQQALDDAERSEAAVRAVVQDAVIDVGIDSVPEQLCPAVRSLGIGHSPGRGQCEVGEGAPGQLDWVRLLRRFVARHLVSRPDFGRPPRRFPGLVGVLPGKRRRGGRQHVLAVIDTSASMTADLLRLVNGELARLAAEHRVTVVECDAEIQSIYPYRRIKSVRGRGGTDLRPPLERPFILENRADLVVYFTDGYGPAPAEPPGLPVLWCLTPDGEKPTEWGELVQMSPASGG